VQQLLPELWVWLLEAMVRSGCMIILVCRWK
jgi:hypothetical protein